MHTAAPSGHRGGLDGWNRNIRPPRWSDRHIARRFGPPLYARSQGDHGVHQYPGDLLADSFRLPYRLFRRRDALAVVLGSDTGDAIALPGLEQGPGRRIREEKRLGRGDHGRLPRASLLFLLADVFRHPRGGPSREFPKRLSLPSHVCHRDVPFPFRHRALGSESGRAARYGDRS